MVAIVSGLYFCVAAAFIWAATRRFAWRYVAAAVFAALCGFESVHWFIPLFVVDSASFPATTMAGVMGLAWAGLDGPTSFERLAVVAIGRLALVLLVFYAAVFAVQRGTAVRAALFGQPMIIKWCVLEWAGLFALATAIDAFMPDLSDIAFIVRALAAVAAVTLAVKVVQGFMPQPRAASSSSPSA